MRTVRLRMLISWKGMLWLLFGALLVGWPVFAPARVNAQQPTLRFERLTIEQGLSQNDVFGLVQDQAGFVWIGTGDGLNRYDGYSFTVYKSDPADPHSLSNGGVTAMLQDHTGVLWVATRRGLNRFNRETNSFTQFLLDERTSSLFEDAAGNLWVGTWSGVLERFDRGSESFTSFDVCVAGSGCALYQDRAGTYWLTNKAGLYRFDPNTATTAPVILDPAIPDLKVFALLEDRAGTFWLGSDHGLYTFDRGSGKTQHFAHNPDDAQSLSNDFVWLIHEDRHGTLWIETWDGGLDQFDPRTGTFVHHRSDDNNLHSLGSNRLFSLLEDRSGLLWFGTEGGGVSILNPATIAFHHYTADPTQPQSMRGRIVSALFADPTGMLWVGTEGDGLNVIDRATGTVKTYRNDPANQHSLSDNTVNDVFAASDGTIWIATAHGLDRFEHDSDSFTVYRQTTDTHAEHGSDVVQQILEADHGMLWIGTENGLSLFDQASGRFVKTYHTSVNDPTSISGNDISALYRDQNGTLWIGSWNGGLSTYDPATDQFIRLRYDPTNPQALHDIFIIDITGDGHGQIWVTTTSGVERLNPANTTFSHIREQNGLPSSNTRCAAADAQGNMWVSTSAGLARLDANANVQAVYTARDGLQSNEFTSECFRTESGELLFGGINGFNTFDPTAIMRDPAPPQVAITEFRSGSGVSHPLLAMPNVLSLPYQDNGFSFDFAALDYADPATNQYAYKLEGFDKDWNAAGTRRTATYTNLDGGNYVFRVKAANAAGVWNETGVAMRVSLAVPPWRTWWAYGLYTLTLAGVVVGFVQNRTGRQKRQLVAQERLSTQLETLVAERTAELSSANDAIRRSEEQFRAFFEQAPVGIVVVDSGVIVSANPAWRRMFGYSTPESLQGRLLVEHIAPADRAEAVERVMRESTGTTTEPHYTFHGLRADSTRFPAFAQVVQAMPFRRATAEVDFVIDMTALRLAEEERDQFFNLSNDLLCIAGTDGYFKRLNPAWETTLGWTRDELCAKPLISFIHPDDRALTQQAGQYGTRGERMLVFENRYRCRDGSYRWLSWSATLLPERQLFFGVARDITGRKLAEREQQQLYEVADGLRDVLSVINSNRSLPEILNFIVGQATKLLHVDAAQIYQFQPAEGDQESFFRVEASRGFEDDYLGTILHNVHLLISYRAMQARAPQSVADTTALLDEILAQPTLGMEQQTLVAEAQRRFRAILAIPFLLDGQVYGTLTLYNEAQRTFRDEEMKLATAFAAQSTLAIENARLRERVEHAAIAEERGRLARSLHDSVTQALYSLGLLAEACRFEADERGERATAQNYSRLGEVAQQALKEMRLLIYQLRTPLLEQEGLVAALQQRLDTVERGSGIKTRLLTTNEVDLPPRVEEEVFWIVQEALNNALKHAAARQVTVWIGNENDTGALSVRIGDDGVGFDSETSPRGVGLSSMEERAARVGASVAVQSNLGQGTLVIVRIPMVQGHATRNKQ